MATLDPIGPVEPADPVGSMALERFGVPYLYPYQRLVIANVLDALSGRERLDQLVILPTGAGKSLCFQLPAAFCPGLTLVVFPLLGLMADQARRLGPSGLGVATLRGGLEPEERSAALRSLRSGAAKIAIANPESLRSPDVRRLLAEEEVSHFVIDEAHCAAEWGDSFRPAYLALGEALDEAAPRVATAFTATASPPVLERVAQIIFRDRPFGLVAGAPDRPNIRYEVRPALSMLRGLREAAASSRRPTIVFAPSRAGVELLAEDLSATVPGLDCRFYHAGLDKAERAALEAWFLSSGDGILCATCAYGMGMDKPDVRTVLHYGPPASVEAYLQESGRAGRDGQPSDAILIAAPEPAASSVDTGTAGRAARATGALAEARAAAMERYAMGGYGCRRAYLMRALGYPGADELACSGCDACRGEEEKRRPGAGEILAAVRAHPRRMDARELAAFLSGLPRSAAGPYRAALSAWRDDEVEEAVRASVRAGLIEERRLAPWKGRLSPAQSGRTSSESVSASGVASTAGGPLSFVARMRGPADCLLASLRQGSAT